MKEKLIIRNFGPIKNVELELGRFNVLIGEQATGKSTVAKVLGFCRYFSNIKGDYLNEETGQNQHSIVLIDELEENLYKWGLLEFVNEESWVTYECYHYNFHFDNKIWTRSSMDPQTKEITYKDVYNLNSRIKPKSKEFANLLDEYLRLYAVNKLNYEFYENSVGELLDNPFFVPTERGLQSIYSLGKDSTSNMSDPLFRYFVNTERINANFKGETSIPPLNIYYKNVNGRSMIRKDNESIFINLSNAASGYQSTIPIVLLIKYYIEIRKKKKTFIIEEPELNLFPEAQQKLINYLVNCVMNYGDYDKKNEIYFKNNSAILTTHSPYILTSLNSLISAFNAGKEHGDEIEKIIERKYWLNPDDVSAYMMLPDGTCEDIFDREENLIHAEKIDGVSSILNKQFDEILTIEFAGK